MTDILYPVAHEPVFNTERAIEHYSKKDGVPVSYVFSTELPKYGIHADIFYRETPHPDYKNRYFGLYKTVDGVQIFNADFIEELGDKLNLALIYDDIDKCWRYSAFRHDYIDVGDAVIDGGRDYIRGRNFVVAVVRDGKIVRREWEDLKEK